MKGRTENLPKERKQSLCDPYIFSTSYSTNGSDQLQNHSASLPWILQRPKSSAETRRANDEANIIDVADFNVIISMSTFLRRAHESLQDIVGAGNNGSNMQKYCRTILGPKNASDEWDDYHGHYAPCELIR